jgi:hypothetical protein
VIARLREALLRRTLVPMNLDPEPPDHDDQEPDELDGAVAGSPEADLTGDPLGGDN